MAVLTKQFRLLVGEDLVEDVVASLSLLLESDSGLFQQVCNTYTEINFPSSSSFFSRAVSTPPAIDSQVSMSPEASFPEVPK